jgi:hypothetical protein
MACIGVECPICHDEAFQLLEREACLASDITIRVKVCPRCARAVDAVNEVEEEKKQLDGLSKAERRLAHQEQSFAWADALHGKKVTIYWDEDTNLIFSTPRSKYHARGTAWRAQNACGGWGQVEVVLDPSEHHRISYGCTGHPGWPGIGPCPFGRRKDRIPGTYPPCDVVECEDREPLIDGRRYGICLEHDDQDGSYYTYVSWGCRKCLVLAEEGAQCQ